MSSPVFKALALAASMFVAASVAAQQTANIGFKSVGRAAPLAADVGCLLSGDGCRDEHRRGER